MLLVVDANVLMSSLISGNLNELMFSPRLELIGPELLFTEIYKHKSEIISKSRLSEPEFEILLSEIEHKVNIIPLKEFISLLGRAEELLGDHIKDAPYIALALKYNCPFWTYEKRFNKLECVKIMITRDVKQRIRKRKK